MKTKLKKILTKAKHDPIYFAKKFLLDKQYKPLKLEKQQQALLQDPSKFRSLEWSRRGGKSTVMCVDAIHGAVFNKSENIFYISADGTKVEEMAVELDGFIHRSDFISPMIVTDNRHSKVFGNQSRIKLLTAGSKSGSKGTGAVGGSATRLYIDEIQDISEENIQLILPTVIGQVQSSPKLTIAGTPRNKGDFTDRLFTNIKYTTIDGGERELENEYGVYSYHRFQICDIDDNDEIINIRSNRVSLEDLESLKKSMGIETFRREFCLIHADTITSVYPATLQEKAGILLPPEHKRTTNICCAGLDYGKTRNKSVLTIAEHSNGVWNANRFKTWELGTQYQDINHYINTVIPKYFPNARLLLFDETGVGKAASETLEMTKKPYKEGITFTTPMKVTLAENCVSMLESERLLYYPHKILTEEMTAYTREVTPAGRTIYNKGLSDDFVDSLNLTALAIHMYELNTSKYKNIKKTNRILLPQSLGVGMLKQPIRR